MESPEKRTEKVLETFEDTMENHFQCSVCTLYMMTLAACCVYQFVGELTVVSHCCVMMWYLSCEGCWVNCLKYRRRSWSSGWVTNVDLINAFSSDSLKRNSKMLAFIFDTGSAVELINRGGSVIKTYKTKNKMKKLSVSMSVCLFLCLSVVY